MRVLIVLALIGVAYAGEAFFAPATPLLAPATYSSVIVDQPKPSYEYQTSVQTPTYNNYAYVRSGGNLERKIYNFAAAPIAAAPVVAAAAAAPVEPIIAEARLVQPTIAQPLIRTAALSEYPFASSAFAYPTTKLLPIPFESKSFYRFAAPAAIAAPAAVATPTFIASAPAQILTVENKLIGDGKSQYHSQNSLGESTYGHRELLQSHDAVQDAQGNKAGSFSYVAPDGRILTTDYVADQAGYRVASNAFPNAPQQPIAVAAQPVAVATIEKPAEIGESEIVVEAKSRNRRSIALAAAPAIRAAPIYTAPQPIVYSNPYAYSSYAYTSPTSYSYAPSYTSSYAYSAAAPSSVYHAPLYRSYAYSYPSSYYYRNLALRK